MGRQAGSGAANKTHLIDTVLSKVENALISTHLNKTKSRGGALEIQ